MADEATVKSTVPVGDGRWSISMATGYLERGDGRPLADRSPGPCPATPRNSERPEAASSPIMRSPFPRGRQPGRGQGQPDQKAEP